MGSREVLEPNLPKNDVKTVLIGEIYSELLGKTLGKFGVSIIKVPDNPNIAPQISSHADMSICHIGGNRLVAASGICEKLKEASKGRLNIVEAKSVQRPDYPEDIALNACLVGDKLFHLLKYTDEAIMEYAKQSDIKCLNVKQGYSKCSVCVLNRDNIITSDRGIHELAESFEMRSLLISPGYIELTGYDTGFIGGCCGKLSETRIAFTGRLDGHPDKVKILDFIKQAGIETVYLTEKPVFDVGSLIPIEEYC